MRRAAPPSLLLVIEAFLPDLTGAATQAGAVAEGLCLRGHEVRVLCRRNRRELPRRERRGRMEIRRLGPVRFRRLGKYLMLPGVALAAWRRRHADVYLVCSFKLLGLVMVPVALAARRPVILRAELNGELDGGFALSSLPGRAPLRRRILGSLIRARNRVLMRASSWISISRVVEAEYLRCQVPETRIERITNGVDPARFRPPEEAERTALRAELDLPAHGPILAYSGRLTRGKGLEDLVEAFAVLAAERPSAHLLLIGSGANWSISVEADLHRMVRERRLERRVIFAGHRHDVERWLRASDLFVFLSEDESLGISLIEAQACGLPVVATSVGGIPDVVVDGVTGLLVPPRSPAAAARAVGRLLADPAGAARMGAAGRRRVLDQFALEPIVDRYEALLDRLAVQQAEKGDHVPAA